jgi:tetratricopeptide (TPR) repeat protein
MKILALATLSFALGFGQIDDCHTLESCQEAVKANRHSSLFHFRLGEIYLERGDYLDASNELRASMSGDLNPKWVEVWAHIGLGETLKMSGQPERAFNEFRQALRTGDNTFGTQDEVARLLKEMGVDVQPRIIDSRAPIEPVEKTPADYTDEAHIAEL